MKKTNGKYKKYKCKDGKNFKDVEGNTYNAPLFDKEEILTLESIWGRKQSAFYVHGQPDALPVSRKLDWKQRKNHDSDVDMLVQVTRDALLGAGMVDMKTNAALGGVGLLIVLELIHMFLF